MKLAEKLSSSTNDQDPASVNAWHAELMQKIAQKRDVDAFRVLFDHYAPRIKGLMMKSGSDAALAEDIVQTVMMTVWNKVHLFASDRGTVSAWVFTIARNARIDRLRRGNSQPYQDVYEIEIAGNEPSQEDKTQQSEEAVFVSKAIEELPAEQKLIIKMAFIEDLPQSEIATKLNLPLGTVKSRMRLAYGKLKTQLEDVRS